MRFAHFFSLFHLVPSGSPVLRSPLARHGSPFLRGFVEYTLLHPYHPTQRFEQRRRRAGSKIRFIPHAALDSPENTIQYLRVKLGVNDRASARVCSFSFSFYLLIFCFLFIFESSVGDVVGTATGSWNGN